MTTSVITADPQTRRWTREEFYRLADNGYFQGQRAELIEGQIMVLSPQKWLHASTVDRGHEVLRRYFGASFWVRAQLPVSLSVFSDPEPDISVVAGQREDYADHPSAAVLLVEVSDTTLAFDQGAKASLYASAGIADYWIINLVDGQLEVYRQPTPDPSQPFGFGYASVQVLQASQTVSPLALAGVAIPVSELLR